MDQENKKEIERIVKEYISKNFRKKIGDIPTDDLQLSPRKYVNLNGTVASRPASIAARVGQQYFSTDLNKPLFFDGTSWRDATSSIIASN